jgi:hypothetical protein
MRPRVLAFTALTAILAAAESLRWSPPVLGYIFDENEKAIRLVAGVPGAANLDATVQSAVKLRRAWIAPRRQFAIIELADGGNLAVLDWSTGAAQVRDVAGSLQAVDQVAFSAAGDAAVVVSSQGGVVQLWRGLPSGVAFEWEVAAAVDAVALSGDGSLVAGISAGGAYLLRPGQITLLTTGSFSAVAFRPGTRDLALASRDADSVTILRNLAAAEPLAGRAEGIAGPAALQFSASGGKLVVVNGREKSFTVVDMMKRSASTVACDCAPESIDVLHGDAVFRVSTDIFLDAGSSQPRTFLVPGENR